MRRSTMAIKRWGQALARLSYGGAIFSALCLASSGVGTTAIAATFDGHSGLNTNWSTPTNWVGDVVPTSGSPNLEVILGSSATTTLLTSNQDLATPFVLQRLTLPFGSTAAPRIVNGLPLAFSNLGGAPSINSLDFLSQVLTVNNDLVLNADLTVSPPGLNPSISEYSLNGAISGMGGLRQTGGGRVFLGGTTANTYAGLTTVDDGVLYLNKPASVIAIPGDVVINSGGSTRSLRGSVVVGNDNQIAAGATVTINVGLLAIEGGDQTLANIRLTGVNFGMPNLDGGSVLISPSRTLTITGGITRTSNSGPPFYPQNISLISGGTLDLAGGLRTFQVDNDNPIGLPTTLTVNSAIANGDIEKTGAGVLILGGNFSGNLHATEGLLRMFSEMTFGLNDGGVSNRILGISEAEIGGTFVIDHSSLTDVSGSWNLVDVASLNETFAPSFKLQFAGGASFTNLGGGLFKSGRWSFSTATGNLSLSAVPEPTTFGLLTLPALFAGSIGRRRYAAARP
jgi:autotransporter-associated beta strand protein